MPHTYTNLLYHIVFSTKDRYPFITHQSKPRIYEYIGGTIRGLKGVCLEIGGIEDHVHMLVKLNPTVCVSVFLRKLKPSVTHWARKNVHPRFEWQDGYGAFTVGESQIKAVRGYIRNQEQHHKNVGFEVEFEAILNRSRIEYEPKYLWR